MNDNGHNNNLEKFNDVPSPTQENNNNLKSEQTNEDNENDLHLLESIKQFFGGPYIDENDIMHDISYTTWVVKDMNIKKLCTPFEVVIPKENISDQNNNDNPFGVLTRHDYGCELKLIKWITEDENHKSN